MDYQYTFRQAHYDRLEDAGLKTYPYPNASSHIRENEQTTRQRSVMGQFKRAVLVTLHLSVK